jgi:hypothetical protein
MYICGHLSFFWVMCYMTTSISLADIFEYLAWCWHDHVITILDELAGPSMLQRYEFCSCPWLLQERPKAPRFLLMQAQLLLVLDFIFLKSNQFLEKKLLQVRSHTVFQLAWWHSLSHSSTKLPFPAFPISALFGASYLYQRRLPMYTHTNPIFLDFWVIPHISHSVHILKWSVNGKKSRILLTGPLMVPDANRSPERRLQPFTVWCASCWDTVQYLHRERERASPDYSAVVND